MEWPCGNFGFVWGCEWGDDSSWKIQYLDLRKVQQGVIVRSDRFGYVELACSGFSSPRIDWTGPRPQSFAPPSFIRPYRHQGKIEVTFSVDMKFDVNSGVAAEWKRLRIENME